MTEHAYNYARFSPHLHFDGECEAPEVGMSLADVRVRRLDGSSVALSELSRGLVVLETGSTTCPLYADTVDAMAELSREHSDVMFCVLYVREAHPGERIGPHEALQTKLSVAASLSSALDERRHVLVDDLGGTVHRLLGSAPNSAVVLGPDARVLAWFPDADPSAIDEALAAVRAGMPVAGVEASFRPPRPWIALAALWRGGAVALRDFVVGLPSLVLHRITSRRPC